MGNASSRNNNNTNNSQATSNQSPAHSNPPQPYPYPPAPTYSNYNAPHAYYQPGYGGAPAYGSNPPGYGAQPGASPYYQGQGPPVPSPYMPYSYPVPTQQYQRTATIRNPVNLKKGSLKLEQQSGSQSYVLSFTFDATSACRVLLFLLAQEDSKHGCKITSAGPSFPAIAFSDGLEQKFPAAANAQQLPALQLPPSVLKDLMTASSKQGSSSSSSTTNNSTQQTYPVIVRLEALTEEGISQGHSLASLEPGCALPEWVQSQTTYARVVEEDGKPLLHVVRQKIWVKGHSYELQEIYGMEQNRGGGVAMGTPAAAAAVDGVEDVEGNDCVICMSAPRDTAALPCRHMCMCHTCAGALRTQTNKCPICRDEIAELLHIKLNKGKQ